MRFRLPALFLMTAVFAIAFTAYRNWPIDGVGGRMLSIVIGEDTVWANGYTDDGWRTVHTGMSVAEVHALLGPPLYVWNNDGTETVHWWTRSPSDSDYRQRAVIFRGDKAVEKISGYWID